MFEGVDDYVDSEKSNSEIASEAPDAGRALVPRLGDKFKSPF